jgi:hypothetical protein
MKVYVSGQTMIPSIRKHNIKKRQEIFKSTVDEIRGKVHQTRNLKKSCR